MHSRWVAVSLVAPVLDEPVVEVHRADGFVSCDPGVQSGDLLADQVEQVRLGGEFAEFVEDPEPDAMGPAFPPSGFQKSLQFARLPHACFCCGLPCLILPALDSKST